MSLGSTRNLHCTPSLFLGEVNLNRFDDMDNFLFASKTSLLEQVQNDSSVALPGSCGRF